MRLIERGARPLRLTEEGAALYARTEEPLGTIANAVQDIKSGLKCPSGRLRISAPLLFANLSLGPLAVAFLAKYPDVLLEVSTDDGFVDLRGSGVDIVIRANPHPDDHLVGRCFLRNSLVLVAPPALSRPNGSQTFPAVMRTGMVDGDAWSVADARDGKIRMYYPKAVMRLSSPLSIRGAVVAGAGAAMVPLAIVIDDVATGCLVQWAHRPARRSKCGRYMLRVVWSARKCVPSLISFAIILRVGPPCSNKLSQAKAFCPRRSHSV